MDHVLIRIKGGQLDEIKNALKADAAEHAKLGLQLRHLWRNADSPDEVAFIFTATDLGRAREYIETAHKKMIAENPNAVLPEMLFLKGI